MLSLIILFLFKLVFFVHFISRHVWVRVMHLSLGLRQASVLRKEIDLVIQVVVIRLLHAIVKTPLRFLRRLVNIAFFKRLLIPVQLRRFSFG